MNDEAGVALDFGDVFAVVVNAVTVECQRRVAEQQNVIRHDVALPCKCGLCRCGCGHYVGRPGGIAVHNVVVFGECRVALAIAADFVAHFHENQVAGTA